MTDVHSYCDHALDDNKNDLKNGDVTVSKTDVKNTLNGDAHTHQNSSLTNGAVAAGKHVPIPVDPWEKQIPDSGHIPLSTLEEIDTDTLAPAANVWTTKGTDAVRLRMGDSGAEAQKPRSVPSMMKEIAEKVPNRIALAKKKGKTWVKWTYRQYYEDVIKAAKSFIKLGLEPYHGMGIIGFNTPEWFISYTAACFTGSWAVGIYTTNSPEACEFVAENSKANVIVVENNVQLQKILKVKDNLPHLKAIVHFSEESIEPMPNLYSWSEFLELSKDVPDSAVEERLRLIAPNKCCSLIYTSGTTGNPKGVMLSHDNLTWTARQAAAAAEWQFGEEVLVSYLPLSHVAAQVMDIHIPMQLGTSVYFAQPDALKGSLGATLKEVRPTGFFGVPRVWEKIMEKMVAIGQQSSGLKRKIATWAKGVGLRGNYSKFNGGGTPFGWTLANILVFKKVRVALGLDRCKMCLSGAAPITKETLEYFLSLNIPVYETYGMSESSGPHTVGQPPHNFRMCSVGKNLPGVQTKIVGPDEDGNGEICMHGRHVFMGYLDQEEKTKETLDEFGRLRTGDIGKVDKDGFLFITGRIKELIITAGGENIPPVPIEDLVKEALPIVANCMLIGDKQKFLSIILCLKTEVDENTTMPKDNLTEPAKRWCRSVGSQANRVSEILERKDENVFKAIQAGIDKANSKSVSRAQNIQKWIILSRDFSIPGGELGPTLKLRRPIVAKMYADQINEFYAET